MAVVTHSARGRAALDAGHWEQAREAFAAALTVEDSAAAHDGLAEALWWLCDARASVRHREQAFVRYHDAGDVERAARAGIHLCISYLVNLGNVAAARGWLARAERSGASGGEDHPLQGWLWLLRGFVSDDPKAAPPLYERALAWAREQGDRDLELVALGDLGYALVATGDADRGITLLDEAMAGTLAGEYRSLDTVVYTSCNMLAACHLIGDVSRAAQWCRVADDFMQTYACPFLFARCRVHYGAVLAARGEWTRAETELQAALDMAEDAGPGPKVEALVRLAELRLGQGRLEEAEGLLAGLDDPAAGGLPAVAIRLARGEQDVAVALLHHRLAQIGTPPVETARTLALLVDAHLAGGDIAAAAQAAQRLADLRTAETTGHTAALAAVAAARVAAATGDGLAQIERLQEALSQLARLELPLERARVRLELARALVPGDRGLAVAQAQSALRSFDDLGADPDARVARPLLRELGAPARRSRSRGATLTQREREVLDLMAHGLTNPEIAQRLFISRKTAAHHVSRILAKLGVRNRAEAVALVAGGESRVR